VAGLDDPEGTAARRERFAREMKPQGHLARRVGMEQERSGRRASGSREPGAYRLVSAAGVLVGDLVQGRPRPRAGVQTLEVLPDVTVRKSAGGELLLFRPGEPRGKTPAEALESGWAHRPPAPPRRPRARAPLDDTQVRALRRAFETCARPAH